MATFDDFRQGDRVKHNGLMGEGTVAAIKNGKIEVIFDQRIERTGQRARGIYDRRWFELLPYMMQKIEPTPGKD